MIFDYGLLSQVTLIVPTYKRQKSLVPLIGFLFELSYNDFNLRWISRNILGTLYKI